jgi:hypothetical protein
MISFSIFFLHQQAQQHDHDDDNANDNSMYTTKTVNYGQRTYDLYARY